MCAGLTGGTIVSVGFLLNPPGVSVRYRRALRLPRYIWVSDEFAACHNKTLQVLQRLVLLAKGSTRWRWQTADELAVKSRKTKAGRCELVALLTENEFSSGAHGHMPGRTTLTQFVDQHARVDDDRCQRLRGGSACPGFS